MLTRIDFLCKLPKAAVTIVNAGGPLNDQWWQGWLSVMLLEAVTRRMRSHERAQQALASSRRLVEETRTNEGDATEKGPNASCGDPAESLESMLLHSASSSDGDVALVLCYSLCGALMKEVLLTPDGWTVWLGAGAWLRFVSSRLNLQLGLNRARCLRLLQCELLTATLSRFVKEVNVQTRGGTSRDMQQAESDHGRLEAASEPSRRSSYASVTSTAPLDTTGLRQNLYLTLQFVAESLLPPRKAWQMLGHRSSERRLPPSFEELVSCVSGLNSLKSKLGLYLPGLKLDVQKKLAELRHGHHSSSDNGSSRGGRNARRFSGAHEQQRQLGTGGNSLNTSPADVIALILSRCLPLCMSQQPVEKSLQFLLEYAEHTILTVSGQQPGKQAAETARAAARARAGSSSSLPDVPLSSGVSRGREFLFSHSEFMVLMIIRAVKLFIQMRPSGVSSILESMPPPSPSSALSKSSSRSNATDQLKLFAATVVLIIAAKFPWHDTQLREDLKALLRSESSSANPGLNDSTTMTAASCFSALSGFLVLYDSECDHMEKLDIPFFATVAAGLHAERSNQPEAETRMRPDGENIFSSSTQQKAQSRSRGSSEASLDQGLPVVEATFVDSEAPGPMILTSLSTFDWDELFPCRDESGSKFEDHDTSIGASSDSLSVVAQMTRLNLSSEDMDEHVGDASCRSATAIVSPLQGGSILDSTTQSIPLPSTLTPHGESSDRGDLDSDSGSVGDDYEDLAEDQLQHLIKFGNRGKLLWATLHRNWRSQYRPLYLYDSQPTVNQLVASQKSSTLNGAAAAGLHYSQIGLLSELGHANETSLCTSDTKSSSLLCDPSTFQLQELENWVGRRRSFERSLFDQRYFLSFQASVHHESIMNINSDSLAETASAESVAVDSVQGSVLTALASSLQTMLPEVTNSSLDSLQSLISQRQLLAQNKLLPSPQSQLDDPLPSMLELQQNSPSKLRLLQARMITVTADVHGTFAVTTDAMYVCFLLRPRPVSLV